MEINHVLIVEDDKEIREGVQIYLQSQGYKVFQAADGIEGLEVLEKEEIHLAIIDIMMPRMDGIRMTMKLREKYDFPVIMLSAKSEEVDKITGLNIGADDYVTKPFTPMELMARVNSQLRRYRRFLEKLVPQENANNHNHDDDQHDESGPALASGRTLRSLRLLLLTQAVHIYHDLTDTLLRLLSSRSHVALDVLDHFALVGDHFRQVLEDGLHLIHFGGQREDVLVTLANQHVVVLKVCVSRVHSSHQREEGRRTCQTCFPLPPYLNRSSCYR